MAFDTYMQFQKPDGSFMDGESQMQLGSDKPIGTDIQQGKIFEIDDFSFDIEQILNIGSQSSGAGAGKVTFNPFQITRKTDKLSPILFTMCCAGQHFKIVSLFLRRAGGGTAGGQGSLTSGTTFLRFDFALVAVKTISWSGADGDDACKEEVTFEYGALQVRYVQQKEDGTSFPPIPGSWNRVYNNDKFDISAGIKAV
jgi:type VI secretion system secreted protein Hcp